MHFVLCTKNSRMPFRINNFKPTIQSITNQQEQQNIWKRKLTKNGDLMIQPKGTHRLVPKAENFTNFKTVNPSTQHQLFFWQSPTISTKLNLQMNFLNHFPSTSSNLTFDDHTMDLPSKDSTSNQTSFGLHKD